MAKLDRFDDRTWDRFFDFLTPDVTTMSSSEVDAEVQRLGLDVATVIRRVHQAVEAQQVRRTLAEARLSRPSIVAKMQQLVAPPVQHARETLRDFISKRVQASHQLVYFNKLEQAATDADLQSLLEDIQRLEAFDGGDADAQ